LRAAISAAEPLPISTANKAGNGKKYELQFESDGSPMTVRKIKQAPLPSEKRRARQTAQLECRHQANAAKVLPRDWTAFILQCLADDAEKAAPDAPR
jgi:hypothetical protein